MKGYCLRKEYALTNISIKCCYLNVITKTNKSLWILYRYRQSIISEEVFLLCFVMISQLTFHLVKSDAAMQNLVIRWEIKKHYDTNVIIKLDVIISWSVLYSKWTCIMRRYALKILYMRLFLLSDNLVPV